MCEGWGAGVRADGRYCCRPSPSTPSYHPPPCHGSSAGYGVGAINKQGGGPPPTRTPTTHPPPPKCAGVLPRTTPSSCLPWGGAGGLGGGGVHMLLTFHLHVHVSISAGQRQGGLKAVNQASTPTSLTRKNLHQFATS